MKQQWSTKTSRASAWLVGGLTHARIVQAQTAVLQFGRPLRVMLAASFPALLLLETTREGVYNMLWGLVFAFATLNILSLGAKRFEGNKSGLSFGEVLAVMVVVFSIVLLGWELLYEFQILPFRVGTPE